MCWDNIKMKLAVSGIILILLVVIVLIACFSGGNRCIPKKSEGGDAAAPAPADSPAP